ncbi:hypothetical protein TREES_T100006802 [Tupaia chinensis]|uniref:Transmembrane protein 241 n=1 Tax=Tupaia chinensis TaxID=246437 RepID=L9JIL9_TUPCH|nr:hypothetical protein TREES_T100006802 [Tupaia chinensis]
MGMHKSQGFVCHSQETLSPRPRVLNDSVATHATCNACVIVTFEVRWQTFIGGLLLHVSWKLGWVEIDSSSRSDVLRWLPASVLFVGIIYAGSRALSRLAIPVFLTLHNVAEVIICGYQKCFRKEKTSPAKICSVVLLVFASHATGDLFNVLDFPFLYFYRFHGSCCASGLLGFFLMISTMKLKSQLGPGQCAAWIFFAKVRERGGMGKSIPRAGVSSVLRAWVIKIFIKPFLVTDPELSLHSDTHF